MYNLLKGDANEFDTEQAYNIFDLDENGTVTIQEFMIMLRAHRVFKWKYISHFFKDNHSLELPNVSPAKSSRVGYMPPDNTNITTIASETDVNDDKVIDFDEFNGFLTRTRLEKQIGSPDPFL